MLKNLITKKTSKYEKKSVLWCKSENIIIRFNKYEARKKAGD